MGRSIRSSGVRDDLFSMRFECVRVKCVDRLMVLNVSVVMMKGGFESSGWSRGRWLKVLNECRCGGLWKKVFGSGEVCM